MSKTFRASCEPICLEPSRDVLLLPSIRLLRPAISLFRNSRQRKVYGQQRRSHKSWNRKFYLCFKFICCFYYKPVERLSQWPLAARSTASHFYFNKNIVGYGAYLSLNRILTPNLNTNEPLYVVNIYQVSFYILLHKGPSVLGAYCRGQASEPTRSAYVCLKPLHIYVGLFLPYISDTFLWSVWHILHWA